jgi:hypothetical protein
MDDNFRIYRQTGPKTCINRCYLKFFDFLNNFCAFILFVSDSGLQCSKHDSYWYGGPYQDRQTAQKCLFLAIHWHVTTSLLGSCQVIFHSSLTMESCMKINILTNQKTAPGMYLVLKSKLIPDWSVENMNRDMSL